MYVGKGNEVTRTGENYAAVAGRNSKIEENIGLSLAKDSRLTTLAAKIKEKSEVPDYGGSSEDIRNKVDGGVDKIGGARAYKEGWGTLGGSVNAVMNAIEVPAGNKDKYSKSITANHPYFPKGVKKPEFDKTMNNDEKEDFKRQHPLDAAKATADKLLGQVTAALMLLSWDLGFMNIPHLIAETKKMHGMLDALLDITLDKHSSGNNVNLVKRDQNPLNPNENDWINDTVKAGKPIISGPSGHTLRYLNFWAEKRNDAHKARKPLTGWPSLQAARLVMMADLMPPKHHSYDEIMTSSIGIQAAGAYSLDYFSKSTYNDLFMQFEPDAHDIAKKAYDDSHAFVAADFTFNEEMRDKKAKEIAIAPMLPQGIAPFGGAF